MNLVLSLSQQLERRLREQASHDGVAPDVWAMQLIEKQLTERLPAELSEGELLQEVTRGLPAQVWDRYGELARLMESAEGAEESDRIEFLKLNELVEKTHANRLAYAAELATRRGVALRDLMDELGFPNHGRI